MYEKESRDKINQRQEEQEASTCVKKDSGKKRKKTRQSKKYVKEKIARKSIQANNHMRRGERKEITQAVEAQ